MNKVKNSEAAEASSTGFEAHFEPSTIIGNMAVGERAILERSERLQGIQLKSQDIKEYDKNVKERSSLSDRDNSRLAYHMVVSFREGTDPELAYKASRRFAQMVCDPSEKDLQLDLHSGERRQHDYVTGFHQDTKNPHMHIVIDRHSLIGDRPLEFTKFGNFNSRNLQIAQLTAAAEFGIEMRLPSFNKDKKERISNGKYWRDRIAKERKQLEAAKNIKNDREDKGRRER